MSKGYIPNTTTALHFCEFCKMETYFTKYELPALNPLTAKTLLKRPIFAYVSFYTLKRDYW